MVSTARVDESALEFTIGIDREVWEALKAEAEPLVDTPNSVLRRRLGLEAQHDGVAAVADPGRMGSAESRPSAPRRGGRRRAPNTTPSTKRAPRGSLLPEEAYEVPILKVLERNGGRVPTREVIEEVGVLVRDRLRPLDHERLSSGGFRWHKRVQFTRLRLAERGLVKKDSPRGVWEITDEGRNALGSRPLGLATR